MNTIYLRGRTPFISGDEHHLSQARPRSLQKGVRVGCCRYFELLCAILRRYKEVKPERHGPDQYLANPQGVNR